MSNTCWAFKTDHVERYAYWDNLFSKEECETIIKYGKSQKMQEGLVNNDDKTEIDNSVRSSKIVFLNPNAETAWFYQRITESVLSLNDRFFKFDLHGFSEGLQFTHYTAPHGKYDDHVDRLVGSTIRKLSIVVQLTDDTQYEGGNFQIIDCKDPETLSRTQGTLLAFPSYALHRVTPLINGDRYSLVGWITGSPFK